MKSQLTTPTHFSRQGQYNVIYVPGWMDKYEAEWSTRTAVIKVEFLTTDLKHASLFYNLLKVSGDRTFHISGISAEGSNFCVCGTLPRDVCEEIISIRTEHFRKVHTDLAIISTRLQDCILWFYHSLMNRAYLPQRSHRSSLHSLTLPFCEELSTIATLTQFWQFSQRGYKTTFFDFSILWWTEHSYRNAHTYTGISSKELSTTTTLTQFFQRGYQITFFDFINKRWGCIVLGELLLQKKTLTA